MERLRDARDGVADVIKNRGFKQAVVASKSGLTEQQLSDIIRKRRRLDANEMFRICEVIGITPNDLFVDAGQESA